MRRHHPRVHTFMTSLVLCVTLVALAVVLTGCKSETETPDHHPTEFVRATGHPCRC